MFEPSDFSDASFSDELEGDIATECGKCGQIEKITVFSKNPLGVVIVKFSTSYASQECVELMDGRFFGGKKLRCYFWDGTTDYTGTSLLLCCAHCHDMTYHVMSCSIQVAMQAIDNFGSSVTDCTPAKHLITHFYF